MPITGWVVVSTSKYNLPTLLFHLVPWPHLPVVHDLGPVAKGQINAGFGLTHMVLAWGALALIALHLSGVLKHLLIDRSRALAPMLPTSSDRPNKGIPA
jgi:cytochrome b561